MMMIVIVLGYQSYGTRVTAISHQVNSSMFGQGFLQFNSAQGSEDQDLTR